ncbi:hypothetical protein B0J11DRAFT_591903 [Dendryphion nanum]|uniref:Uncharacterized protein n=1 Tax=Dendryphion nanum TaxID=256645 RepID=A0A9P9DDW4_9PLEO|nr:hypothetical protein B0J11DRAFT_591903 [Dendryphion nanum]
MSTQFGPLSPSVTGPHSNAKIPCMIYFTFRNRRAGEENNRTVVEIPYEDAQKSWYLRSCVERERQTTRKYKVDLPEADPEAFKLYRLWLHNGHLAFPSMHIIQTLRKSPGNLLQWGHCLGWEECLPLLCAYVLGVQMRDFRFQDYVIDALAFWLVRNPAPDLGTLEFISQRPYVTIELKEFLVELMIVANQQAFEKLPNKVEETAAGQLYDKHEGLKNKESHIVINDPDSDENLSDTDRADSEDELDFCCVGFPDNEEVEREAEKEVLNSWPAFHQWREDVACRFGDSGSDGYVIESIASYVESGSRPGSVRCRAVEEADDMLMVRATVQCQREVLIAELLELEDASVNAAAVNYTAFRRETAASQPLFDYITMEWYNNDGIQCVDQQKRAISPPQVDFLAIDRGQPDNLSSVEPHDKDLRYINIIQPPFPAISPVAPIDQCPLIDLSDDACLEIPVTQNPDPWTSYYDEVVEAVLGPISHKSEPAAQGVDTEKANDETQFHTSAVSEAIHEDELAGQDALLSLDAIENLNSAEQQRRRLLDHNRVSALEQPVYASKFHKSFNEPFIPAALGQWEAFKLDSEERLEPDSRFSATYSISAIESKKLVEWGCDERIPVFTKEASQPPHCSPKNPVKLGSFSRPLQSLRKIHEKRQSRKLKRKPLPSLLGPFWLSAQQDTKEEEEENSTLGVNAESVSKTSSLQPHISITSDIGSGEREDGAAAMDYLKTPRSQNSSLLAPVQENQQYDDVAPLLDLAQMIELIDINDTHVHKNYESDATDCHVDPSKLRRAPFQNFPSGGTEVTCAVPAAPAALRLPESPENAPLGGIQTLNTFSSSQASVEPSDMELFFHIYRPFRSLRRMGSTTRRLLRRHRSLPHLQTRLGTNIFSAPRPLEHQKLPKRKPAPLRGVDWVANIRRHFTLDIPIRAELGGTPICHSYRPSGRGESPLAFYVSHL